jgi:hypothetical protein
MSMKRLRKLTVLYGQRSKVNKKKPIGSNGQAPRPTTGNGTMTLCKKLIPVKITQSETIE